MRFIAACKDRGSAIEALRSRLADLACSHTRTRRRDACPAGDGPQLEPGVIHEWCGVATPDTRCALWVPPVRILVHYARRALHESPTGVVLWIGASCWPYPRALIGSDANRDLLRRSLFVDVRDLGQRVWAIDLALRSAAAACVIADASGLCMSESRRLQLGAAAGGSLAMLARPPWEARELSAAHTRWLVGTCPSLNDSPRWTLELLRRKGSRPTEDARHWSVEYRHETGDVRVVSISVDRPAETTRPQEPARLTA